MDVSGASFEEGPGPKGFFQKKQNQQLEKKQYRHASGKTFTKDHHQISNIFLQSGPPPPPETENKFDLNIRNSHLHHPTAKQSRRNNAIILKENEKAIT